MMMLNVKVTLYSTRKPLVSVMIKLNLTGGGHMTVPFSLIRAVAEHGW